MSARWLRVLVGFSGCLRQARLPASRFILLSVCQVQSVRSFVKLLLQQLCTSISTSIAPAVGWHDKTQPDSTSHTCSGRTVSTPRMTFLCITIFIVMSHRIIRGHFSFSDRRPHSPPHAKQTRDCVGVLLIGFVLCIRNISDHCSLQIRQSSLFSNLCSVPVVAMTVNPPDPVEQWILSACATWPKPQDTPRHSSNPSLCWSDTCWSNTTAGF